MPLKRLLIEDDSDCATCTERHESEWELLAEVRCSVLTDVQCPECGRTVTLLVEETNDG